VFSAVASHSTKGIINTTTYPVDKPFAVKAVHSVKGEPSRTFMKDVQVAYDAQSGCWKTEASYLWPYKGTLRFYAVSPIVDAFCPETDKGINIQWSIPTEAETQTDLCFAEVSERCTRHSAIVPVVFSHALSQICIKARTLKQYTSTQKEGDIVEENEVSVILDSVLLKGIISKGCFNQETPAWTTDADATTDYWIYKSTEGLPLGCDKNNVPVLTRIATMLFIPQQLGSEACIQEWHHVHIHTVQKNTSTGEILEDVSYNIPKSSPVRLDKACKQWKMDYKYTFRIAVGMEDPELSAAVTDWTENKEIILGDE